MFKIGQKVVFVGLNPNSTNIPPNPPKIHEICIISDIDFHYGDYQLMGYETSEGGDMWMYDETELRPLDESFAEEILEQITQQIEEEELILSK